jgi:hypothetical protein
MNERSQLLLFALEATLLTKVGQPTERWRMAQNLDYAIKSMTGAKYESVQLEWRNQLTEFLAIHHKSRYRNWNKIVVEAKEHVIPLCTSRVALLDLDAEQTKAVFDSVSWDIVALFAYLDFSDLTEHPVYDEITNIYLAGHLLCGWDRDFLVF